MQALLIVILTIAAIVMAIGLIVLATMYLTPFGGGAMAFVLWRIFEQNFHDKTI